jgi:putative ABC transport system substrate-binding protein
MRRYVAWETALLTVLIVAITALGRPLVAAAQQPGPVPRIAVLELSSPPSAAEPTPWPDAFRHGLRERGWVEGHTIALEWRWAEGSPERFAALVAEVLRLQVAVLVVPNSRTAWIAKRATSTIPIVVVGGGGMLANGLVASLARPGGNVTGLATLSPELTLKHLELLKEAVPGVTRVAVLQALSSYSTSTIWPQVEATARSLGMALQLFEVRESTAFDSAFAAMTQAQADALLVLGDPFFTPYRARIAALALQHRLPSIGPWRREAEAGYLLSYGTSVPDQAQRIAGYVDKILRGASPADLPVEQPMQFELVLNLKTAQTLGLPIPPTLLFQANDVIR